MLTPQIYLSFNGDCEAAFRYYAEHLGGTIQGLFPYAGSPEAAKAPPGWETKVMHGSLKVGDIVINGADVTPASVYEWPQGFQLFLEPEDPAEAERLFAALAAGGTVEMPLQQTFWSIRFGVVRDRFGIPWSINCAQAPQAG